jgi:hypothetical protein
MRPNYGATSIRRAANRGAAAPSDWLGSQHFDWYFLAAPGVTKKRAARAGTLWPIAGFCDPV